MGKIQLKEQATPETPSTGYADIYPKTDGLFYTIDDAGTERQLITETDLAAADGTTFGIASFNSDDFTATDGVVSLGDSVAKTLGSDSGSATATGHGFIIAGGEGVDTSGAGATITISCEDASTTNKGILEIATDAEAVAGTATDKALVPSNVDDILAAPPAIGGTTPNTGAFSSVVIGSRTLDDDYPLEQVNLLGAAAIPGAMSNSGLAQGSGSGRQTDYNITEILADADGSSHASWAGTGCTITDGGANLVITESGSAGTQEAVYACSGLVANRLYKVAIVTADGTGAWGASDSLTARANGGGATRESYTGLAAGTHSLIFKAVAANDEIAIGTNLGAAAGTTLNITSIYIDEVTSGCVAANTLGPDGWWKYADIKVRLRFAADVGLEGYGCLYAWEIENTGGNGLWMRWPLGTIDNQDWLLQQFVGKTVTFAAAAKASAADKVNLRLYDGTTATESSKNVGSAAEWITVTQSIDSTSPTYFSCYIEVAASSTVYVTAPMLVFGSHCAEYVPPQDKLLDLEANVTLEDYNADAPTADTSIILAAQSNGKIPDNVRAVHGILEGQNTAAAKFLKLLTASSGVEHARLMSQVAATKNAVPFRAGCNSDGNIYLDVEDGNWSNVTIQISAVEVR